MENVLATKDLCKKYGKHHILNNVTLDIPKGAIFGLVGRNGAGKTTLMRILTGLAEPTSGTYSIGGIMSNDRKILSVRRRMGSIIESPAIYRNLSAYDNVKLQYINLGMTSYETIPELLELILILDEPINGLDPQGIIQMREILLRINHEKHTTILISSHILEELSKLATHYAFIEKGEILQTLSSQELMSKVRKASRLKAKSTSLLCPVFDREGIEYKVEDEENMDIYSDITTSKIVALANEAGTEVISVSENNESLEGYFMNLVAMKDGIS